MKNQLEPRLAEARAGQRDLYFGDAAHFVLDTFLCCLWCKTRLFVKAAAGRQRYNVLGAWNAVTNSLVAVTNTTVVSSETACELLRKIAAQSVGRPVTVALDNARYQYCQIVRDLAQQLGIELLYLPSYSPNPTDNTAALLADPERNAAILARIPAGRWGEADDLHCAVVFLASPASDYMHGTIVTVDGGWMGR